MDKPFTRIGDRENEDHYTEAVYGREVNGKWEYAVIRWTYSAPHLRYVLRDGEMVGDAGPIQIVKSGQIISVR